MDFEYESSTYYTIIRQSEDFRSFEQRYNIYLESFKIQVDNFVKEKTPLDMSQLEDIAETLVPEDMSSAQLFAYLSLISTKMNYLTIAHMFNSGLICRIYAKWLQLSPEESCILVQCGFLYDIGKCALPEEILMKEDKLSDLEFDLIRMHAFLGYVLLSRQPGINDKVLKAALQHHERSDGSGYPQRFKAYSIDSFASMISIVDVYEAMTSVRSYREPLCAYQAIELFQTESLQKYDLNSVNTFLNHLADDFIGSYVKLSNGMEGKVLMKNSNDLARPLVLCGGTVVDLAQDKSVSITAII